MSVSTPFAEVPPLQYSIEMPYPRNYNGKCSSTGCKTNIGVQYGRKVRWFPNLSESSSREPSMPYCESCRGAARRATNGAASASGTSKCIAFAAAGPLRTLAAATGDIHVLLSPCSQYGQHDVDESDLELWTLRGRRGQHASAVLSMPKEARSEACRGKASRCLSATFIMRTFVVLVVRRKRGRRNRPRRLRRRRR